jgi:hypothetical protein
VLNLTLRSFATLLYPHVSTYIPYGESKRRAQDGWRGRQGLAVPFVGFLRGRVGAALGLRVEILAGVPGGMLTIEGAFRGGNEFT